jgi:Flp pilus assembly pilin Flp
MYNLADNLTTTINLAISLVSHRDNLAKEEGNMANRIRNFVSMFVYDEQGQGITEYGAILAFVATLIVLVAGFVNGGLKTAVSQSFSRVTSSVTSINTAAT